MKITRNTSNLSPAYRRGRPPKLIVEIINKINTDFLETQDPGSLLPTQQELTRRYGVSRATIRSAFEILEYRKAIVRNSTVGTYVAHKSSQLASALSQKEIAVSFARSYRMLDAGTFPTQIISGILGELSRNDMHLALFSSDWRWEKDNPPQRHLASDHIIGCVLLGHHPEKVIASLKATHKPLVAIDFNACDADIPSFVFDNISAGEQLARRLWRLGHRRVVTLFESPDAPLDRQDLAWRDRRLGFLSQWSKYKSSPPIETFTDNRWDFTRAYKKINKLLKQPPNTRPTAIVLPGWGQLNSVSAMAFKLDLTIPKDLSLMAMGMSKEYTNLTGIRFNGMRMGGRIGANLINMLLNPGISPKRSKPTILKGRYVAAQTHGQAPD